MDLTPDPDGSPRRQLGDRRETKSAEAVDEPSSLELVHGSLQSLAQ